MHLNEVIMLYGCMFLHIGVFVCMCVCACVFVGLCVAVCVCRYTLVSNICQTFC